MVDSPGVVFQALFKRLPLMGGRMALALPAGAAITLIAYVLRIALDGHLPAGFPYVTFFPAVVISALLFGLWGGITSAVMGFVLARWFFVAPQGSLSLEGAAGWAMLLYTFVVLVDIVAIHGAQVAFGSLDRERRRSRDLAESRELLFHELQHRVGNNLQMVGSLLAMQGRRVAEGPAREAVEEAARRVRLVGKIQRTLYGPQGAQRSLSSMLDQLVADLVNTGHGAAMTVRIDVGRDTQLLAEQAIPVALIVSEAVSNALEHAFELGSAGSIIVRVDVRNDAGREMVQIVVQDDGFGLPAGFDIAASDSLGLKIARSLATGLGGTFAFGDGAGVGAGAGGGTASILTFPMPDDARPLLAPERDHPAA